jgi:aldehyde:ferredoxin oxidoreductase
MSVCGYHGKILFVDLSSGRSETVEPGEEWYRIIGGGGLLGAHLLLTKTSVGIDPLSPENLLIFASSVIAGNAAPGLARFSVMAKSPLTGGIAETRCEGPFGVRLKASGYDAVVFAGRAQGPVSALIDDGRLRIERADALWGTDTWTATKRLQEAHPGADVGIAAIGQAGENLARFASIVTDYSIQAMRMGVGAVMGSKNLKAVVLKGGHHPPVHDADALAELGRRFETDMRANVLSMWQKDPPGFSAYLDLADTDTAYLGILNYTDTAHERTAGLSRQDFLRYYRGDIPCPGCPNDCIKRLDPGTAFPESTGIHQEVSASLGPNVGNLDLPLILELNAACNRWGMDPVSLGFTISFAMEAFEKGHLSRKQADGLDLWFGNTALLLPLVEKIALRQGLGDVLAEGAKRAAGQLGRDAAGLAMHVKGLEMVSFEPRTMTNLALGYATAPVGPRYDICEHDWDFDVKAGWEHSLDRSRTLGILRRIPMQYVGADKVRNYRALNAVWSACDALDLCVFASAPTRVWTLEMIASLIHAITGWETSSYEFMRWGDRRNHLMRVYNLREGLTAADDTLPDRFFTEPIRHGRLAGTVLDRGSFAEAVKTYYQVMGWDSSGVPLPGTLVDHHLDWAVPIVQG